MPPLYLYEYQPRIQQSAMRPGMNRVMMMMMLMKVMRRKKKMKKKMLQLMSRFVLVVILINFSQRLCFCSSKYSRLRQCIISYPTINPVVLSVPLVSLSFTFPGQKPILDVVLSPLLLPKSGTIYRSPLKSHHHLTPSNVTSKHTILPLYNFLTN